MRARVVIAMGFLVAGCAHLTDSDVLRIAARELKDENLEQTMACGVATRRSTWLVYCQVKEPNMIDGGTYLTIDRLIRRVINVQVDG